MYVKFIWHNGIPNELNKREFMFLHPTLVTLGRMIGTNVIPLDNLQTLQQSSTLYCSSDVNTNTARIGWSFTPFGQEIEESLTYSAQWESTFGMSKLYISTSKLGYYSCYTSEGDVLKKYTVKLTQPTFDTGNVLCEL